MKSLKDSLPSFPDVMSRFILFFLILFFIFVFIGAISLLYIGLLQDPFPWYWNVLLVVMLLCDGFMIIENLRNFFKSPSEN